jgi:hypothetical protein
MTTDVAIAQTKLYRHAGRWIPFVVAIFKPEPDPLPGGDYRCAVRISGHGTRFVYGLDSFQSLNLAFVYIRSIASRMAEGGIRLYCSKDFGAEFDIKLLMLNDFSRFLGSASPANSQQK